MDSSDGTTLPAVPFYGLQSKKRSLNIKRTLENRFKHLKEEKCPNAYHSRIVGPSIRWKTFYRQQEALDFVKGKTEDLHVFAFECRLPDKQTGQRQFLAATYPVFWHYYMQLDDSQRHHYEVIPEGDACKLYFDLEFHKPANPHADGVKMVDTAIKYVNCWLRELYDVHCDRDTVLELSACTESKFSRHLIFQSEGSMFEDNLSAGGFVRSMFGLLEDYLSDKIHQNNSCTEPSLDSEFSEKGNECQNLCQKTTCVSEVMDPRKKIKPESVNIGNKDVTNNGSSADFGNNRVDRKELDIVTNKESVDSSHLQDPEHSPKHCKPSIMISECCGDKDSVSLFSTKSVPKLSLPKNPKEEASSEDSQSTRDKMASLCHKVFQQFELNELGSLFIKDKDGRDTCFVDLGVYTKNRNFRLFKSCKLGKKTAFTVSAYNTFVMKASGDEKDIFLASLITNVRSHDRLLTYVDGASGMRSMHIHGKKRPREHMEGCGKSPYPEIDDFISSQVSGHGGAIRRWSYFPSAETISFDIVGYRFCYNVQRQHRSNNIRLVADLQKGVWYQKCYDPDCQTVNFKSQEFNLPPGVLPAFYFSEDFEDNSFNDDDDACLLALQDVEQKMAST